MDPTWSSFQSGGKRRVLWTKLSFSYEEERGGGGPNWVKQAPCKGEEM
jgi:hypothetical protein